MTTVKIGLGGVAPTVSVTAANPERAKYQRMWEIPNYRESAPGEGAALTFLQQARMPADSEVIDFGCGTGRGALMLALFGAAKVRMLDFADNCLDPEVRAATLTQPERISFNIADLTHPKGLPWHAAYGYCTDVMEHIPPQDVKRVLTNILASAEHVFFQISCVDDVMGALIGAPLHLTVKPAAWWIEQLTALGAVIHWSQSDDTLCMVYCSAWKDAEDVTRMSQVNTAPEVVDAQVKANIEAGWQHITPHDRQSREIVLLAGGPSMKAELPEILKLRAAGAALVTVNGSYEWAISNSMDPSLQIVLDARQFNAKFTRKLHPTCKYLLASQVHPDTLADLPKERTWLWHSGLSDENEALIRQKTGFFFPIPGGSTVILRAIPLLRMLGFTKIHLFGFDSCVSEDSHHAYAQPENDNEPTMPLTCGGRTFNCTPWMVSQAAEFRDLVKFMGDEVELAAYGDGLIAHMIKHGASFAHKE